MSSDKVYTTKDVRSYIEDLFEIAEKLKGNDGQKEFFPVFSEIDFATICHAAYDGPGDFQPMVHLNLNLKNWSEIYDKNFEKIASLLSEMSVKEINEETLDDAHRSVTIRRRSMEFNEPLGGYTYSLLINQNGNVYLCSPSSVKIFCKILEGLDMPAEKTARNQEHGGRRYA